MENVNNERNIFARFRTNNCGGSQLFENIDAALTWVQSSTRNTVESGYARADFTVRDTEGNIYYKGYTTKSKYCYEVYCGRQCTETINYKFNKEQTTMKENNFAQTSSIFDVVENEVKEVAAATMKVAIASKELNDEEFVEAIEHASRGLVFFRRSTNNPERVDFCSWEPYTATHKKKDPGKKRFNAIESTIIDTYQRGRSMKAQGAETVVAADRTAKESVKDIISNIVNIVQIYLHEDEIVKRYLRSHSSGIESELSSLTRGVIVGSITGGRVELSSATGKSVTITTEGLSLSDVSGELSSAVTLLLTHAALCSQTRNVVDCLVDVDELSELYFSNTSISQAETPHTSVCEQDTVACSYTGKYNFLETSTDMPAFSNVCADDLNYIVHSIPIHRSKFSVPPSSTPVIPRESVKKLIKRF